MTNEQRAISEAIAALRARLETWGVEEAPIKAEGYVRDMIRNGWRPAALPVTVPTSHDHTPPPDHYRAARLALKGRTE